MDNFEEALKILVYGLENNNLNMKDDSIPVGISNRHVHLSKEDLETLFGKGYELTKLKDLSQPGQYAAKETVIICGPKGAIEKVRILGATREKTQIEILAGDCFKLGIKAEPRLSGKLDNTPGLTIIGSQGSVQTENGLIIGQRHIHMLPEDADKLNVKDGENVSIKIEGIRSGVLDNVIVRAVENSALECHLDMEEANAMGLDSKSKIKIIK
ncbi:MAG: phosphate propanoyltransferase [Miniphocaeibacter sp.]|uniref:phosphate propanoyltransferase n=1 Tax=Miniphocaeibacter sp. TaxID=3100973 RepID=UPI00181D8E05|nr:phosphate propanoyltransferase [Gallicola sp.]